MSDKTVAIVCFALTCLLLAYEALAATKEERKAERRAEEARYMVCLQECRANCGGWK